MTIHLDRALPVGLGDQLRGQIRALVDGGALRPGEPLPTARSLAEEQGVNVNTVVAAYAQLESEGYVVQRKRAGTRVADAPPTTGRAVFLAALGAETSARARAFDVPASELVQAVAAHAALEGAAPRFRVALLAENPLQARELLARARMLFRPEVALTAVTPDEYHSRSAHLTVVHPHLTARLAAPNPVPSGQLDFGADFPAPAD